LVIPATIDTRHSWALALRAARGFCMGNPANAVGLARKEQRAVPEWQREGGAAKKTNGRTRRYSRLGAPVPDQKDAPGFIPARYVPTRVHQWFQEQLSPGDSRGTRRCTLAGAMTVGCAALLPPYCNEM
jgi:hypothetical protein